MRIYGGADMQLDTSTGHIKLMPAGNVGIGMVPVSGKYKLDVAGAIHATSDICTDSGGGKCLSDPPPPLDCSACGTGHSCWDSYTAGNSNYEHCGSICTPAGWRQLAPCGSYY